MKRLILVLTIVAWLLSVVMGCDQQATNVDKAGGNQNSEEQTGGVDKVEAQVIFAEDAQSALAANLHSPDVELLVDSLETWGYSYRQENSVIVTMNRYERTTSPPQGVDLKLAPDHSYNQLVGVDTLIWQVFENASYDSILHTALFTVVRDDQSGTILQELDISQPTVEVVKMGMVVGGVYVPGESGDIVVMAKYWKEALACCAACAAGCIFSGPAWPSCVLSCCAACYAYYIAIYLINWFFPD